MDTETQRVGRVPHRMTERDTVPKDTAKKLWPEWYEYRINQGKSSKWSVNEIYTIGGKGRLLKMRPMGIDISV